jgi:hypothetical protein
MAENGSGDSQRMTFWEALNAGCGTEADRRNQYSFVGWCLAWALTLTGVIVYLETHSDFRGTGAWLLAVLPFALSIGALLSYLRFLRMADELLRKIQVEGLAIGFGAGVLFTLGYRVLERAGAPQMSASDTVLLMIAGWLVGQLAATWHYR